jgi:hypothetical protein
MHSYFHKVYKMEDNRETVIFHLLENFIPEIVDRISEIYCIEDLY